MQPAASSCARGGKDFAVCIVLPPRPDVYFPFHVPVQIIQRALSREQNPSFLKLCSGGAAQSRGRMAPQTPHVTLQPLKRQTLGLQA